MNETKQTLINAKALISDPKKWTQGASARTACGAETLTKSHEAVCFCSIGAIARVSTHHTFTNNAIDVFKKANDIPYISTFNDNHSHADVMEAFDKAIAAT